MTEVISFLLNTISLINANILLEPIKPLNLENIIIKVEINAMLVIRTLESVSTLSTLVKQEFKNKTDWSIAIDGTKLLVGNTKGTRDDCNSSIVGGTNEEVVCIFILIH